MAYAYGSRGQRCIWTSIARNRTKLADLVMRGPSLQRVIDHAKAFRPDVAICDAEPWTHAAASRLGIPRISFDHYGVLAYCNVEFPSNERLRVLRDVAAYRIAVGRPERVIVSSFYPAPAKSPDVRVVGPVLRKEVLKLNSSHGDFLLVYLNQGDDQLTPHVEHALRSAPMRVVVYGTSQRGTSGNLEFHRVSNDAFLEHLATCRAIFSTAGNQLVGEALHLRKPHLVTPEHTIEQRVNAAAVERMGIGMQVPHANISPNILRAFIEREEEFRAAMKQHARDGRVEAIGALETFMRQLVQRPRRLTALASDWSAV
jgi:uncharacterized protein (TIGR00661 family)